jgi:uncharacterized membrane-anchored protein
MNDVKAKNEYLFSKVPEVTIFFWIIKILCTTVGETFSDFINVNMGLGLVPTTIVMGIAFAAVLFFQMRAKKYIPVLYWLTVVLISVFGTLVTDNLTDGLGVPLQFSTVLFSILLLATFFMWYRSEKTLSVHSIFTMKREVFYWLTILFTFALGTAVGDLYSETFGLGYLLTGIIVAAIIISVFVIWKIFRIDSVLSFWVAYVFTRPLGASLGDYLSQPRENGGLGLGTTITSIIFLAAILAVIIILSVTKIDAKAKNTAEEGEKTSEAKRRALHQTVAVLCAFVVLGAGSYAWCSHAVAVKAQASGATLQGHLDNFISIETDIQSSVDANDFSAAKTKAKELETTWDTEAAQLKAIDKTGWKMIDATIDSVLSSVRKGRPDAAVCNAAIESSLAVLNSINQ